MNPWDDEEEDDLFDKPLGLVEDWESWPEADCGPIYFMLKAEATRERELGGDADSVPR